MDSGFVILRLLSEYAADGDSLAEVAKQKDVSGLIAVLERYAVPECYRALRDETAEIINRLETTASRSSFPPLHRLSSYWRIDARPAGDLAALVRALNEVDCVDIAYAEHAVTEASLPVDPFGDEFTDEQGYMDPAPSGIDGRWAWTQQACQGAGIALADIEGAWNLSHEDLKSGLLIRQPSHGTNGNRITRPGSNSPLRTGNHGTAALGIAVARDNLRGIIGIAPAVTQVQVFSYLVLPEDGEFTEEKDINNTVTITSAILAAIGRMRAGEILLLEVQLTGLLLPIEVDDMIFDAIRLAVAHGIIVIEAAGNGSKDLDVYLDPRGNPVFEPLPPVATVQFSLAAATLPKFSFIRDSGAILIGAAHSARPHDRLEVTPRVLGSNYGARIDCYAWGENVMTLGYGPLGCEPVLDAPGIPGDSGPIPPFEDNNDPDLKHGFGDTQGGSMGNDCYTAEFSGTSAASAIIAGTALVLQGKYEANTGARLSPGQMRRFLSNPATGTPQGPGVVGNIGTMPDLKAIIRETMCLVPDVYARDHPADTGAQGVIGAIVGESPDIAISTSAVAGPATFSAQFGVPLSVNATGESFVFVRVRNRGSGDAPATRVSIYRAPTATWVPPTDWVLIGKTEPVDVPAGDQPIVVGPVPLSRDATSGRGGRLIAVIDQADDPAPPMPSSAGSAHPFDLNHNNIASRGFRVPGNIVQGAGISAIGEFDIGGLPDGEVFELLIEARVAASDQLLFEVEEDLGSTLNGIAGWATSPHWVPADGPMVMLPPRALPCIPLVVAMAAGMRTTARFKIEPGGDAAVGPYHIVVRQMLGGQEIGRISWDSVTNTDGESYP